MTSGNCAPFCKLTLLVLALSGSVVAASASKTTNVPGTASLATMQTIDTVTNGTTTLETFSIPLTGGIFTAPTGNNLLLETTISGSVSDANSANLLSVTTCFEPGHNLAPCSIAGDTLQQNPNITSSGSFSDTASLLVASLGGPDFELVQELVMTFGEGAASLTLTTDLTPNPLSSTPLPAALPLFTTGLGQWVCLVGVGSGRRKRSPPEQTNKREHERAVARRPFYFPRASWKLSSLKPKRRSMIIRRCATHARAGALTSHAESRLVSRVMHPLPVVSRQARFCLQQRPDQRW